MHTSIISNVSPVPSLRRRVSVLGIAGLAALLGACGASSDEPSPPVAHGGPTSPSTTIASDNAPTGPAGPIVHLPMRTAKGKVKTVAAEVRNGVAYYQGDIDLGDPNDRSTVRGAALSDTDTRWRNATVPYAFSGISSDDRATIRSAMAHIELRTPIRFVEKSSLGLLEDGIVISPSTDSGVSSSKVGRQGGNQSLKFWPGHDRSVAIHELGHALGLKHEQSRPDRNSHVTVHFENIEDGREGNFEREDDEDILDEWFSYDMDSRMHYRRTAFCKKEWYWTGTTMDTRCVGPTITANDDYNRNFSGDDLSPRDINVLTAMYGKNLGTDETNDEFGRSMAVGDFDNDGRKDIVVGAPGEAIGSGARSGAVYFYKGTGPDVMPLEILSQATPNADGDAIATNESSDEFGAATVAADFDDDGFTDLAVGAPNKAPWSGPRSGGVMLFKGTAKGLVAWRFLGISSLGKTPVAGDRFGASLAAIRLSSGGVPHLVVGAPGRGTGGAVYIMNVAVAVFAGQPRPHAVVTAATPIANGDFGAALAVGDFDGDGRQDLAVGAPGNGTADGGTVRMFLGNGTAELGSSRTMSSPGTAWSGDKFGFALAAVNFDSTNGSGRAELVVGAPGKRKPGTSVSTGAAFVYQYRGTNLITWQQTQSIYPGSDTDPQAFGSAIDGGDILTGSAGTEVAIGAPRFNGSQGRVVIMRPSSGQLVTERTLTGEGQGLFGSAVLADSVSVTYPPTTPSELGENPVVFVGAPQAKRFPVAAFAGGVVYGYNGPSIGSFVRTTLSQGKTSPFMTHED